MCGLERNLGMSWEMIGMEMEEKVALDYAHALGNDLRSDYCLSCFTSTFQSFALLLHRLTSVITRPKRYVLNDLV